MLQNKLKSERNLKLSHQSATALLKIVPSQNLDFLHKEDQVIYNLHNQLTESFIELEDEIKKVQQLRFGVWNFWQNFSKVLILKSEELTSLRSYCSSLVERIINYRSISESSSEILNKWQNEVLDFARIVGCSLKPRFLDPIGKKNQGEVTYLNFLSFCIPDLNDYEKKQLRENFLRLANRFHPDRSSEKFENYTEIMKEINHWYFTKNIYELIKLEFSKNFEEEEDLFQTETQNTKDSITVLKVGNCDVTEAQENQVDSNQTVASSKNKNLLQTQETSANTDTGADTYRKGQKDNSKISSETLSTWLELARLNIDRMKKERRNIRSSEFGILYKEFKAIQTSGRNPVKIFLEDFDLFISELRSRVKILEKIFFAKSNQDKIIIENFNESFAISIKSLVEKKKQPSSFSSLNKSKNSFVSYIKNSLLKR